MSYRHLLVHLDDHERCAPRVALAVALARRFESHLTGLAATGRAAQRVSPGPALPVLQALEQLADELHALAAARAERFRAQCDAAGLRSFEALVDDDDEAASLVRRGHASDLLVLGQTDPDQPDRGNAQSRLEEVVLQGSRPTLIVPHSGRFERVGSTVVIAWNGGREGARAVADAMPLLIQARRVHLLQCESAASGRSAELALRQLAPVRQWLAWHGIDAQPHVEITNIDVGNALLSRAFELEADLLVMGAYGHPRWSERVLGGATRTVLGSMTLPVLMSH